MLQERRRSPRIPFDEDVIVYAEGRRLACRGTDLSAGGIGLLPPEAARPGLHVIVDVALQGSESLAIEGHVVRQEELDERYAWGVQFHEVSPRVQRRLDAHIAYASKSAHRDRPVWNARPRRITPELPLAPRKPTPSSVLRPSSSPHQPTPSSVLRPEPRSAHPTPSSVSRPEQRPRRTPTSTEQRRVLGPRVNPTPSPAPAPAFDVPRSSAKPTESTLAEPSPAFTFAPEPAPALPRRPLRTTPSQPAVPVAPPRRPTAEVPRAAEPAAAIGVEANPFADSADPVEVGVDPKDLELELDAAMAQLYAKALRKI